MTHEHTKVMRHRPHQHRGKCTITPTQRSAGTSLSLKRMLLKMKCSNHVLHNLVQRTTDATSRHISPHETGKNLNIKIIFLMDCHFITSSTHELITTTGWSKKNHIRERAPHVKNLFEHALS